jgi:YYY domain-containing protein
MADLPNSAARRRLVLGLICLVAFTLRIWNLHWDGGTHQHPDERFWSITTSAISGPSSPGEYFDSASSPLNPYNVQDTFVYGTAPLFTTKAVANYLQDGPGGSAVVGLIDTFGIDLRADDGTNRFNDGYEVNVIGRLLSALIDTATVLLVYLLARDLFDRRAGLVAAALYAGAVLPIQYAHFFGAEPWATFLTTAVVLGSVRVALGRGTWRTWVWTGAALGIGIASKLNVVTAVAAPLVATAIVAIPHAGPFLTATVDRLWRDRTEVPWRPAARSVGRAIGFLATVLVVGAAAVRTLLPYAFDGLISRDPRFTADLDYLRDVNSGGAVPWVVQWTGRSALPFALDSAFWWGLGAPLGLLAFAGVGFALWRLLRGHDPVLLIPLVTLVVLVGLVGVQFNPLNRYLLPAYPLLAMFAARAVTRLWDRRARVWRLSAAGLVALSALWGLAFVNGVYGKDHPRVAASEWIGANIEPGATLTYNNWDDSLPLAVSGVDPGAYELLALDPFHPDRANLLVDDIEVPKPVGQIQLLDQADYVIEASNKAYDALPHMPARYPSTLAYYDALFDGRLGFEKVAEFHNAPSLFGIEIDDRDAEETFTVYDHPTVTIFRKTDEWSVERATAIMNPPVAAVSIDRPPGESGTNTLQLYPDERAASLDSGAWSDAFDPDGLTSHLPWLWWLLWLEILAFAVLPLTTKVAKYLPDRGFGLTKALALIAVGLPAWALVAWDVARFGPGLVWTLYALVVAIGAATWWRGRAEMAALWRQHRRVWLGAEATFLVVFGFFLWLRANNPDLWDPYLGGEKFMEIAYLTAIARSPILPAADPWFAGGALNYYYGGWFLVAVPIRALRIPPEVAFNLAVPTFAAATAAVAYSISTNLAALRGRLLARSSGGVDVARPRVRAGILGALLLVGFGNLDVLRLHIDRLQALDRWDWAEGTPVVGGTLQAIGGFFAWITGTPLTRLDWWAPSRVNQRPDEFIADITEFPYFTYLFGDLHPHLMGMVFFCLVIALGLTFVTSAMAGDRRRMSFLAVSLGLAVGVARMVNTWDVPASAILIGGFLTLGAWLAPPLPFGRGLGRWRSIAGVGGTLAVAIGSFGVIGGPTWAKAAVALGLLCLLAAVLPTAAGTRVLRLTGHLGLVAATHLVVFWPYLGRSEVIDLALRHSPNQTSPFDDFLRHFGLFLFLLVALIVAVLIDYRRQHRRLGAHSGLYLAAALSIPSLAVWWFTSFAGYVCYLLAVACVWLIIAELRASRDPAGGREVALGRVVSLGLFCLGLLIVTGVEFAYFGNDVQRMNTIFKFWLNAWQLFALGAAFAMVEVARVIWRNRTARVSWSAIVGVIVIAGLAYPMLATRTRLETRLGPVDRSLDGLAYLQPDPEVLRCLAWNPADEGQCLEEGPVNIADDLALIDWLRDNVEGAQPIVEWPGRLYDWTTPFASHTGLPSVIGWDYHQKQQRWKYHDIVEERIRGGRDLYTLADPDAATAFLRAYDVRYVIVGTTERRFASPEALAMLTDHALLTEVYRSGDGLIYQVTPGEWTEGV